MRALVVDDSAVMRTMLRRVLKKQGFEAVIEASQGVEALERLAELNHFELILIDWNMPTMDGLELLRRVRSQSRYAAIPIMMVTTETSMNRMSEALAAGANDYMMKPFTLDVVADKLRLMGL